MQSLGNIVCLVTESPLVLSFLQIYIEAYSDISGGTCPLKALMHVWVHVMAFFCAHNWPYIFVFKYTLLVL